MQLPSIPSPRRFEASCSLVLARHRVQSPPAGVLGSITSARRRHSQRYLSPTRGWKRCRCRQFDRHCESQPRLSLGSGQALTSGKWSKRRPSVAQDHPVCIPRSSTLPLRWWNRHDELRSGIWSSLPLSIGGILPLWYLPFVDGVRGPMISAE